MDRTLKAGAELLTGEKFKPIKHEHSPEIESYPEDYVEYSLKRLGKYKEEHGKLPEWERDITEAADEINRLAEEAQAEL